VSWSLVQQFANTTTGTSSNTATPGAPYGIGNLIEIFIFGQNGVVDTFTISASTGSWTFSEVTNSNTGNNDEIQVWNAVVPASGLSSVLTVSGTGGSVNAVGIVVTEYSGLSGAVAQKVANNSLGNVAGALPGATVSGNLVTCASSDNFGDTAKATTSSGTVTAGITCGGGYTNARGGDHQSAPGGSLTMTTAGGGGWTNIIVVEYTVSGAAAEVNAQFFGAD
jgi:hypothetical protein